MIRRRIFYVLCAVCLFILFKNGLPSTTLTTNITYTIRNTIPPVNHRHGGSRSRVECPKSHACLPKARYLSPSELLDRPYPPDIPYNSTIPRLIHQSWSTTTLPIKYQKWSDTWRVNHPDWEWVLWTDEDNQALVNKYFPWMKETYERLPMINKVDLSRNMYMYVFGGYQFPPVSLLVVCVNAKGRIYADLDVECLRPFGNLFSKYLPKSMALSTPGEEGSQLPPLYTHAYFGQMGANPDDWHSIPNAWMASTPAHPFFLKPMQAVHDRIDHPQFQNWVEGLSGPVCLRLEIVWYMDHHEKGKTLIPYLRTTQMNHTYFDTYNLRHSLTVLPSEIIYPYAWTVPLNSRERDICSLQRQTFDAERCKDELMVREHGAYAITYWSHSWSQEGPYEHSLEVIMED
jgi:inositol phosphorylceramide mannosyltransferase catalytic subunit